VSIRFTIFISYFPLEEKKEKKKNNLELISQVFNEPQRQRVPIGRRVLDDELTYLTQDARYPNIYSIYFSPSSHVSLTRRKLWARAILPHVVAVRQLMCSFHGK
jgi:hypothetical protein